MKIFIFNTKYILSIFSIIIISIFIFLHFYKPFSIATSVSEENFINNSIKEKFEQLENSKEKVAYLTFDDGPTIKATPKILDILKDKNVKATFFVLGKNVKSHPELVKRAYEEGHYIANHGYNHNNSILYKNSTSFISEVKNTDMEIGKAIGVDNYCSYIFRFPNGYMSSAYKSKKKEASTLLSQMGYIYVDWNCLNNDSEKKVNSYTLLNNLKNSCKNKGTLIILMHDTNDVNDTTEILAESISYLQSEGYVFDNFYSLFEEK